MRFLLPVLLALFGAGAGIGAGLYLQPASDDLSLAGETSEQSHETGHPAPAPDKADDVHGGESHGDDVKGDTEFTKLNNQFVVPVLSDGMVKSMVVLSLSVETPIGKREAIYAKEPRIRDDFLQVLFDHANSGGFDGEFTHVSRMKVLRGELRRSAQNLLGEAVIDVLITDIARQDLG